MSNAQLTLLTFLLRFFTSNAIVFVALKLLMFLSDSAGKTADSAFNFGYGKVFPRKRLFVFSERVGG